MEKPEKTALMTIEGADVPGRSARAKIRTQNQTQKPEILNFKF